MRTHRLAPLLLGLVLTALAIGCNSKGSSSASDPASTTSSAPGTMVKPALGISSAGNAASARPASSR